MSPVCQKEKRCDISAGENSKESVSVGRGDKTPETTETFQQLLSASTATDGKGNDRITEFLVCDQITGVVTLCTKFFFHNLLGKPQ